MSDTKSFSEYLEKLKNYEIAIIEKASKAVLNRDKISADEKARKERIIALYDKLLPIVHEISEGDYDNIHIAASVFNTIRQIEGHEVAEPILGHKALLQKYEAHPVNNLVADRKEDQDDLRCGMHALNHLLQEEKVVCFGPVTKTRGRPKKQPDPDYSESIYFDKHTMKPWSRAEVPVPKNRDVLLNISGICKAYNMYVQCATKPCNMIEIGILQAILNGTIADPDLPNIDLGFKTKGIEINYDKLSPERKAEFINVEAPIYIELIKILLSEKDTIGALINLNGAHYTALVSKNTMIDVNKEADFTYIDSLDLPCSFGALNKKGNLKQPKYFNSLNKRAEHLSGNYKFDDIHELFGQLLQNNQYNSNNSNSEEHEFKNIDITIVKYKNDGSTYFCRSLEHILRSANNNDEAGGSRKHRTLKRKTRRYKARVI